MSAIRKVKVNSVTGIYIYLHRYLNHLFKSTLLGFLSIIKLQYEVIHCAVYFVKRTFAVRFLNQALNIQSHCSGHRKKAAGKVKDNVVHFDQIGLIFNCKVKFILDNK